MKQQIQGKENPLRHYYRLADCTLSSIMPEMT